LTDLGQLQFISKDELQILIDDNIDYTV